MIAIDPEIKTSVVIVEKPEILHLKPQVMPNKRNKYNCRSDCCPLLGWHRPNRNLHCDRHHHRSGNVYGSRHTSNNFVHFVRFTKLQVAHLQ